jgi:hypothetical protein
MSGAALAQYSGNWVFSRRFSGGVPESPVFVVTRPYEMRSDRDMKCLKEAPAIPEPPSSMYVLRSVMSGFAAIFMLICIAAALSYTGIEHIHAEAASSFHSLLDANPTH